jgi:hypothetical protein
MTLQAAGLRYFPTFTRSAINRAPLFGSLLIDAASESVAFVMPTPKAGDISHVGFRTGTVTTGATLDIRAETVDPTTGDPTGTLVAVGASATQVVGAADDNTWFTVALTTAPTVTKGPLIAVVVANPSTSFGNMSIAVNDASPLKNAFPYTTWFAGGSWTKNERPPLCSLEYSDGSYEPIPGVYPFSALASEAFNSASTPDERGIIFQVPWKMRVTGFWLDGTLRTAASIVKLYDSDGSTVLLSRTIDEDQMYQVSNSPHRFLFDTGNSPTHTEVLDINTNYRLTLTPTTTTSVNLGTFSTDTVAIMDTFDGAREVHATERTDAGAWTETTTKRYFIGVIPDQLDDGAGGGGGLTAPAIGGNIVL